jgi:competence protein ComEA
LNTDKYSKRLKFNTKEKRGALAILVAVVLLALIPSFCSRQTNDTIVKYTEEQDSVVKILTKKKRENQKKNKSKEYSKTKKPSTYSSVVLTKFDPDTLALKGWTDLGLSERQAEVLLSYKDQLGGFSSIEQLYTAFVLDSVKVNSWKPYLEFNTKPKKATRIKLNNASIEDLTKLKGIGVKFAERIIKFRDKLGGFHSVEQLREVYGLPIETIDSIINQCEIGNRELTRIMINQLEASELAKHPYIDYKTANLVVKYREQHGVYHSIQDLRKLQGLSKEFVDKIEPYLNFNE